MSQNAANLKLRFEGYNTNNKSRNKRTGGGVSIITKHTVEYEDINLPSNILCEILGIEIITTIGKIAIFTWYNPPKTKKNKDINEETLNYINSNFEYYIIVGDLNSKNKSFGCKETNKNGEILVKFLEETGAIIINDTNVPTYHKFNSDYQEVLDLCILSRNLASMNIAIEVGENTYKSDHSPVIISINIDRQFKQSSKDYNPGRNYRRANWGMYKTILNNTRYNSNESVQNLSDLITKSIEVAANKAIPMCQTRTNRHLPTDILEKIRLKRRMRREFHSNKDRRLKNKRNTQRNNQIQ
jgi:exonuclease III